VDVSRQTFPQKRRSTVLLFVVRAYSSTSRKINVNFMTGWSGKYAFSSLLKCLTDVSIVYTMKRRLALGGNRIDFREADNRRNIESARQRQ
jgi:hypothetical protein